MTKYGIRSVGDYYDDVEEEWIVLYLEFRNRTCSKMKLG